MSLIAHYPLNGNAEDHFGNHDGTPIGVAWNNNGKIGKCAEFDGVNDRISFGTGNNIFPLFQFSMAMWFNSFGTTATSGTQPSLFGFTYGIRLRVFANYVNFGLDNGSTFIYLNSPSTYDFYNPDKWYHIVAAANSTTMFIFIDGELVATRSTTWSGTTRWPTNTINIGRDNNNNNYYFRGLMDDFRIYDHVLSEREVKDLARGIVANYSFDREAQFTKNVVTNTNLDTGWSKGYAKNIIFDEIAPPPGVDSPTVGFEDSDADGTCYWYSYGDYAPQEPGKLYAASVWMKVQGGNVGIRMYTANNSEVGRYSSPHIYVSDSDGWKRVEWDVFRNASDSQSDSMSFNFTSMTTERVWLCAPQLELNHHTPFVDGIREDFVSDNSGNGNNAILDERCPQWVQSELGGAYKFNGDSTRINVPNTTKCLSPGLSDFSVVFWMKSSSAANERILSQGLYLNDFEIWKIGYIRATIADGSSRHLATGGIPIDDDIWHHVVIRYKRDSNLTAYIDGVLDTTFTLNISSMSNIFIDPSDMVLGQYSDGSYQYNGFLQDFKVYMSHLTEDDVKELYQTGLAVDDHHRMHSAYLNESGIINPNLLDYTTWTVGTTGSESGFSRNGSDSENHRVLDNDPFGKQVTIWEARPDANSGADGGWNASYQSIDNTKMHRLSVWIRRTVKGNGSHYFGTNGGGSAVLNRSNGVANSNPYFSAGGWGGADGQWRLFVGHVWPVGSGTGPSHVDSGIYENGVKIASRTDFVCASGTTSLRHRAYAFYCTDITTRQQFVYPRIDVCDGTEPSIEALLAGFDSLNYDRTHDELGSTSVPDNLGVKRGHTDVGQFSEVGITRGMVSWFPLKGDAKDRVSNDIATVTGAVPTGDGYDFDGVDDQISTPLDSTFSTESHTVLMWVKYDAIVGTGTSNRKTPYFANGAWTPGLWADNTTIRAHCVGLYATASWTQTTEWRMVGQVFDKEANVLYIVVDGELITGSQTSYSPTAQGGLNIGGHSSSTAFFPGLIKGTKTFNTALTPEEVAQEYQSSSKSMINKSTAFAKEFIEV